MPFKSEKQRRWMHANEPAMAKRWEKESKAKPKKKATTGRKKKRTPAKKKKK